MLSGISRAVGAFVTVTLMLIGAKVVADKVFHWKRTHDRHS